MTSRVENIKSDNSNFNQRLMDVEIFCQTNGDSFDEFNKKTYTNSENITNLKDENRYLSLQLSEVRHNYANLKEEFLELKTRNMQENLLFFGIAEEVNIGQTEHRTQTPEAVNRYRKTPKTV